MAEMPDDMIGQFLIEAREAVTQAAEDFEALGQNGADAARIGSAFRAIHSLKGLVALFDFAPMLALLHSAEDLMGAVRADASGCKPAIAGLLLQCADACGGWLEQIAASGKLPAAAAPEAARLTKLIQGFIHTPATAIAQPARDWLPALLARDPAALARARTAGGPLTALRYVPDAGCFFRGEDPMALLRQVPGLILIAIEPVGAVDLANFDPYTSHLSFALLAAAPIDELRLIFRLQPDQIELADAGAAPDPENTPTPEATTTRSLRIDAARLDHLVDLAGELVTASNGLAQLAAAAAAIDPDFGRKLALHQAAMGRSIGDTQRAVMQLRLVPLGSVFRRVPRLVRDIAGKLGKQVAFGFSGAEVEADKAVADGLFDPLLHIIRNALDHGIEAPEQRIAAGKPAEGRLQLSARLEHGQVWITVSDDGAGIDPGRLRAIAKARHVMNPAAIDALPDAQVADLIFMPGFSTAANVTELSGRGVGMDAVRSAVTSLGGRIAVQSRPGVGTDVVLALPQTIAITTIVILHAGGDRFGVPIQAVQQTMRVATSRIQPVRGGEALVWRERAIPVVKLAELLDLPAPARQGHATQLLIIGADQPVAIEVDGFGERHDVLLRPLDGLLASLPGMAGTALLGDGQVLLVLDLPGLLP